MQTSFRNTARHFSFVTVTVTASLLFCSRESTSQIHDIAPIPTSTASPRQDDATLRAVTFAGSTGYAVGDQGVVWKSTDAGATWNYLPVAKSTADVSWESVSFPTNRVGWIAGGRIRPYERTHEGVLYFTMNGGESWESLDQTPLPMIKSVRFFDLDNGVAVTESSTRFASGVLTTDDGGRTWKAAAAKSTRRWRTGAFVTPVDGVVVGDLGEHAVVARAQILPPTLPASGLENVHAVTAELTGRCWLAGDGGLLMTSSNGGVSWGQPATLLPHALNDFARFYAIAQHGTHVWVGGAPGSVIWHSPDNGQSWEQQATGSPLPLNCITFADARHGCAVGSLGRIDITHDGGTTWKTVRGEERRLAYLALHAHPQRVSIPLFVKSSGEDGYRGAVVLFSRNDVGPDAHATSGHEAELRAAVLAAGGNDLSTGWRLPLAVPGIARNRERLLEDWSLLTDRRFAEVILSELVSQLRTWRPSIVIIDDPLSDDAAAIFLKQALETAVAQAGDPAAFTPQAQHCGLTPWQVEKVFLRRPVGSSGTVKLDPFDVLPRHQSTLGQVANQVAARVHFEFDAPAERHEFSFLMSHSQAKGMENGFWTQLAAPLSPAARRSLPSLNNFDYDALIAQADHHRIVTALTTQMVQRKDQAGMLIAQLDALIGPLPPAEAAEQLAQLGAKYREQGEWALAEETYANLLDRYPNEPVTVDAMKWLVQYWTSSELNYQRLRAFSSTQSKTVLKSREQVQGEIQQAMAIAAESPTDTARNARIEQYLQQLNPTESLAIIPTSGNVDSVLASAGPTSLSGGGVASSQQSMQLVRWLEMANRLTDRLAVEHPRMFSEPEIQFVTASLMRRRQKHREADEINNKFLQLLSDDPWAIAARGEAYLLRPGTFSPKPVIDSKMAVKAPVLDGLLSDPCWSSAVEITLSSEPTLLNEEYIEGRLATKRAEDLGPQSIAMICHDAKFLYLAASVPREPRLPLDGPQYAGRPHDADLAAFDHLVFSFDVDRDYATTYEFAVDQRGWTRESVWNDRKYNPQWFVAIDADERAWRLEAAIPLDELVPPGSQQGAVWGLGVTRVMPGLGVHSWTGAGGEVPQPARFGMLRFSR